MAIKHGKSHSREYSIYTNMKTRCYNRNNSDYHNYGERGIKICDRWLESFENFYIDMGECPRGLTLERIDNNGHYCLKNCKWDTRKAQNNNTRSNRIIEFNGKKQTKAQWAEELKIPYHIVDTRLRRGWTLSRVLSPLTRRPNQTITFNNKTQGTVMWAKELQIPLRTLSRKLACGESLANIVAIALLNGGKSGL